MQAGKYVLHIYGNYVFFYVMQNLLAQLEKIVETIVTQKGFELVDVKLEGSKRPVFSVFIHKPGGVTVSDCQSVNRALSDTLDTVDIIPGKYFLVVSLRVLIARLQRDGTLSGTPVKQ